MPNPTTLNQDIAQIDDVTINFWMMLRELLGTITHHIILLMAFTPKDDRMQIDKMWLKTFMEQEKQRRRVDKLCLYYGKPSHIVSRARKPRR
jgi:hypothetical protein